MPDTVELREMPDCDVHRAGGEKVTAEYDAKLTGMGGRWAFVCQECFEQYGPGRLGTGYGQKLLPEPKGTKS